MSDFFDRMIARVQGDTPRVEPVLPSWFETRGPNLAAADSASAAPADFEWRSVPWFADENQASDSAAIASSDASAAPPRPAQSQFSARVSARPQADDRASYLSGPADVADAVSSVLPSPRPETRPVTASPPAEPRAQRQATANASAERDTAEPPVPRSARAHEPMTARPMHKWPEREPSVQELVTKVHTASLEFRSEPAAEQPILPARTRGLLEPAGPAATDRSSRATTRDETNQPARIRSIRADDDRASSAVPAEAAGPTIHITIGRVELRTVTSSARVVSAPTPAPAQPALSLDEYLRQRAGGER